MRTSKLQLTAEQPSTGECVIPPRKETPCSRENKKPHQDGRRGKIAFKIKPHTCQRFSGGSNRICAYQDPEAPQRLSQTCLWVSECLLWRYGSAVACLGDRGSGYSRPGSHSAWHKPSWRRSPLTSPQSPGRWPTNCRTIIPSKLTVWIITTCGKLLKRWGYQTILPISWETYMRVKKQQLEPCVEQLIGSELRKEYNRAVCCHRLLKLYAEDIRRNARLDD